MHTVINYIVITFLFSFHLLVYCQMIDNCVGDNR